MSNAERIRLKFTSNYPLKYGANAAAEFDNPDWPRFVRITDVTPNGGLRDDLLNTNYFHVVFTLPHELNPLALTSRRPLLELLFDASSRTLLEVAADPKRLGAEIGFLSILHTWGSNLLPHYHSVLSSLSSSDYSFSWEKQTFPS